MLVKQKQEQIKKIKYLCLQSVNLKHVLLCN